MPNNKITKSRLKNHWVYSSWKYILMVIIFVFGWNLIYSVTAYKPPREKRLDMYFLESAYSDDLIRQLAEEITPEFPDMEEVNFYTMNYGGDEDVYGPQILMTRLATAEGDVYMVDEATFISFVNQEIVLPLDEYVESGALPMDGQDLSLITRAPRIEDDEGNIVTGDKHIYGIKAEPLYRFVNEGIIDNRDKYIVVMAYTDKPDVAVELINVLFDKMKIDKPQWIIDHEESVRRQLEEIPSSLTVATPAPSEEIAEATSVPEAVG